MPVTIYTDDKYFELGLKSMIDAFQKSCNTQLHFDTVIDAGEVVYFFRKTDINKKQIGLISLNKILKSVISKKSTLSDYFNQIINNACHMEQCKYITPQELNVLLLLVRGVLPRDIVFLFNTSEKTISNQKMSGLRKLGCKSLRELIHALSIWERYVTQLQ